MEDPKADDVVPVTEAYVVKPMYEVGDVRLYASLLAAKQDFGWDLKDHIHVLATGQVWGVNGAPQWGDKPPSTDYAIQKVMVLGERLPTSDEALQALKDTFS